MNRKERYSPAEKRFMTQALELAALAREKTYPNPMVGAVIVKSGKVIGKGFHKKAGEDHAEAAAIKNVKGSCKGASMFVTLEPCDHFGKTPPCTEAIIKAGISKVYLAMTDPNPLNSGKGTRKLRSAGIEVYEGLLEAEAAELLRKYVKFITRKIPYVTLKLAESLDGKISAADGSSKWISGEASRSLVKRMREEHDAVMVGIGTVLKDDPFLLDADRKGYATRRVVIDSRLRIPERSNLISTAARSRLIIGTTSQIPDFKLKRLGRVDGVEIVQCRTRSGRVDLKDLMAKLAERGIVSLLVEGGGELAGSLVDERLVDEVVIFIAPKLIGGGALSVRGKGAANIKDAVGISRMTFEQCGDDIVVRGRTCFPD